VRKKLGVRTVFNLLGPMVNPAKTKRQFMGVYDAKLLEPIGLALKELGSSSLVLVSGLDGMDEISLCAPSRIFHLKSDTQTHLTIKPEDFGFKRCEPKDLQGGSAKDNADIMIEILEGKEKGPKRDIVLLNSAAALVAGDVSESLKDGLELAKSLLDSGKAMNVLQSMRLK
jgi:anthranilate phosphoribosyltransferase